MSRKEADQPKYIEVYEQIKHYFLEGFEEHDMLPTEVQLASQYGVGRGTVRAALKRLVEEGLIIRQPGKGTYLAPTRTIRLKKYTIGVILSEKEFNNRKEWEYSWSNNMEMLNGIYSSALEFNMQLELVPEEALNIEDARRFDGFLYFRHIGNTARKIIGQNGIAIEYRVDIEQGLRILVEHSLSTGNKQHAYIGSRKDFRVEHINTVLTLNGYPPLPDDLIVFCGGTSEEAYKAVEYLFSTADTARLDSIFCSTDLRAAGVLEYCRSNNIPVPQKLSVYGFDGSAIGKTTEPALTTCAFDWQDFGSIAVQRLRAKLDQTHILEIHTQKGHLKERDSAKKRNEWFGPTRPERISHITELSEDISTDAFDSTVQILASEYGLSTALHALFLWSVRTGYIDPQLLEVNEQLISYDHTYDINFQVQINYSRQKYTSAQTLGNKQISSANSPDCHICKSLAGSPGKELLRVLSLPLAGRGWFVQLTPYPLYPRHIVVIDDRHIPMSIDAYMIQAISDFVKAAPDYIACSNSDRQWAGASILEHLHFQAVDSLHLPVFEARFIPEQRVFHQGMLLNWLDYPMPVLYAGGFERTQLNKTVSLIIDRWKARDDGNTCNLVHRKNGNRLEWFILFRNPRYRNPSKLKHIKSEGIGVIEAAGAWIFPPPTSERLHKQIISERAQIISTFFAGIAVQELEQQKLRMELLDNLEGVEHED